MEEVIEVKEVISEKAEIKKRGGYGGKFRAYNYGDDKDFCLDTTPHELLDRVPRKSLQEQVQLYIDAGVQLEQSRRASMLEAGLADEEIPDDIDELATPFDSPQADVQDIDAAMRYLDTKFEEVAQARAQAQKKSKEPKASEQVDTSPVNNDNKGESVNQ